MAKRDCPPCEIDMTPMIDVTFQLIIFFIVTFKINESFKQDIELEDAKHGMLLKETRGAMIVEVDRKGAISMYNCGMSEAYFKHIVTQRFKNSGDFPVMIRADKRTKHSDVRKVMDICSSIGIWKINFLGIQESKESKAQRSK